MAYLGGVWLRLVIRHDYNDVDGLRWGIDKAVNGVYCIGVDKRSCVYCGGFELPTVGFCFIGGSWAAVCSGCSTARARRRANKWETLVICYGPEFTKELKNLIRQRDHCKCQGCGITAGGKKYPVHHIDYDKRNNNPINLITLCSPCHAKTTTGERESWTGYFKSLMCGYS